MKRLAFILVALSFNALADAPYISNNIAESREHVTNGEITCDTSKPQATINAGVYGSKENEGNHMYQSNDNDKGAYIGISIPIGNGGSKVDCSRLYDLSVKEKELKIKMLEAQVAQLQSRKLSVEE